MIFTQVLDTVDRWVKHASKDATFPADYVNALVVIARRRKALEGATKTLVPLSRYLRRAKIETRSASGSLVCQYTS